MSSVNKSLHKEFEQFCKDIGISKTGACENAIRSKLKQEREKMKCENCIYSKRCSQEIYTDGSNESVEIDFCSYFESKEREK